jgi:hypothetical protein
VGIPGWVGHVTITARNGRYLAELAMIMEERGDSMIMGIFGRYLFQTAHDHGTRLRGWGGWAQ